MSIEDDLLSSLAELESPEIDPEFAARVRRLAQAELARATTGETLPLRLILSGAVVPSLLVSAAAVHSAESTGTAARIFSDGGAQPREEDE
jgi:hypothetical protein